MMAQPTRDLRGDRRVDLRGTWQATEADDDVRRQGIDLDSDDDGLADGDVVSLYSFSDQVTELAPPTTVSAPAPADVLDEG